MNLMAFLQVMMPLSYTVMEADKLLDTYLKSFNKLKFVVHEGGICCRTELPPKVVPVNKHISAHAELWKLFEPSLISFFLASKMGNRCSVLLRRALIHSMVCLLSVQVKNGLYGSNALESQYLV